MNRTLRWQKSTFSDGGEGDTCVELAASPDVIHLRESDTPTTHLTTTPTALAHLLNGIRTDRASHPVQAG
ncbi:DUF397 domain-containing protein [Streptomyces sp. NPDC003247]|uniref:DUF397 domain-containing protein n=1 Tax=Streptomyces sp. NPDC003247 TaxID=3364677 RepID=UPI003684DE1E